MAGGSGDLAMTENVGLGGGEGGGLGDGARRPARVTARDPAGSVAQGAPGLPRTAFGDADQQQGEPADQDVGADAVFEPVEDRPEQEFALHVTEAAFGFEQVLVAQGGVLGADVRVGRGEQVLAVQPCLGLDFRPVDDEPPGRGLAEPAAEARVIAQRALGPQVRGFGVAFGGGALLFVVSLAGLRDPVRVRRRRVNGVLALGPVAVGLLGVGGRSRTAPRCPRP